MDAITSGDGSSISIIGIIVVIAVFLFSKMRGGRGGSISLPGGGRQRPSSPLNPAPTERPRTGNTPTGGSGAGDLVRDLEKSGEQKKEF